MGQDFYTKFKKQRAKLGIKTYMLAPDGHVDENNNIKLGAYRDPKEDKALKIIKTWLPVGAYESAVEWNVYDNKVVLISYGEEAFATVIQSKQIAESVKELFRLAKNNIRS
jgi:hypothetical protein